MKASAQENFRRTLVFHHVVKEAEAFAAGLPDVAAQLHASDPVLYPKTIGAGIEPATEDEKPKPRPTQAGKWTAHLGAAQQFFEREGHLTVPRKHVETVLSTDGEELQFRLGAWVNNQRSRAAALCPERVEQLSKAGMRWA
ncbi:helicase associated domain-containing protein [Streptomyces sp. NPDC056670]|uniref:helicase associated domain-containing protein n=1 Tax=Streptomyces sp. NPDC056670 TaxID=3345904 RepID=UPI0036BABDD2